MTSDYKFLHYDVSEGIASIKLDRPPVNAIHEAMTDEYFDALDHADSDDAVKVIVLSGEGKGLSAGADLKYLAGFGTDEMARFLEKFYIELLFIINYYLKMNPENLLQLNFLLYHL